MDHQANLDSHRTHRSLNDRPTGTGRKDRVYVHKGTLDLMLVLTWNRSIVFFGKRHYCIAHDKTVDSEHQVNCDLIQNTVHIRKLQETV